MASKKRQYKTWDSGELALQSFGVGSEQVDAAVLKLRVLDPQWYRDIFMLTIHKETTCPMSAASIRALQEVLGCDLRLMEALRENKRLSDQVFDYLKERAGLRRITVVLDDNGIRGLYRYEPGYNEPIAVYHALREQIGDEGLGVDHFYYDRNRGVVDFMAILTQSDEPPRHKGEVSHAALHVQININGDIQVSPAVYASAGTNGLISRNASIVERVWISELRPVLSRAHELLAALMASDEHELHDKSATVARIARDLRLPNSAARRIGEIAARKSVVTAYDLISAVTSLANDKRRSSRQFRWIGFDLLAPLSVHRCEYCGAGLGE